MRPASPEEVVGNPVHSPSISLRVRDINQLFNSMDPSPFVEKDLDDRAEEFIVGWAQEFPKDAQIRLRIDLEQWPTDGDPQKLVQQAVQNHFGHGAELSKLELRSLMKQGRTTLLIGLSCLAICLATSRILLHGEAGTWASILRESLTIAGWVAMWRPMQIYLYDWWPLRRRGRLYTKLSQMPVEVIHNSEESRTARSERERQLSARQ